MNTKQEIINQEIIGNCAVTTYEVIPQPINTDYCKYLLCKKDINDFEGEQLFHTDWKRVSKKKIQYGRDNAIEREFHHKSGKIAYIITDETDCKVYDVYST